jgi:ATP-binding cassette, subfamily F, member 3
MILLNVTDVRKRFGPEPVLEGVTFELRPGERVGLVGPNGCGKTTLLRILAGREEADAGSIEFHPTAHLGYLEQQPEFEPGRTLHDEARSALADLLSLQQEALEVAQAIGEAADPIEQRRLARRYDHLQHELHLQDAYNLDHRIEQVLDGLRFSRASFDQPAASLSGGEQNRLMLAKLLLAEPNVMVLDEPSNHLDIDATEWLEDFLVDSSAAMLVVSHDRYFLDKVTTRTLELFHGTVDSYAGNFSAYWHQKAERLLVERRTYEKQQTEIEKTKDFIRRNAYGQKHAQAEDRRKKLDRIEPVAPPREIAGPPMRFDAISRTGDIVARAEGVAKSYDRPLFVDVSFDVLRGQRWALLGPNGCGKTTLLRCLLGIVEPDRGRVQIGQGILVGYFDQQLAELADDLAVVDAIRPKHKQMNEPERRNLLARFGITGERAMQPVGQLSGGERCRAALARLAAADANFLVLDEPTNHLDLWARDALETAISQFDGSVLLVSHDRYFVNRVADHLLLVESERVRTIEGNYDTYQMLLKGAADRPEADVPPSRSRGKENVKQTPKDKGKGKPKGKAPAKASEKAPKQRRFPFRKVRDLEDEIFERETCIEQLQQELSEPEVLRDGPRVREIKAQIEEEQAALKTLYEHWDEAMELNW